MDVSIEALPTALVVHVVGEIDLATAPTLTSTCESLQSAMNVVIDLSDVSFIDSSGLNVLVQLRHRMQSRGDASSLKLVVTRPTTQRIFEVTGLTDVFAMFGSVDEALAAT